ncbi:hypothetical protein L5515_003251 [Caenorhabditis briggsae]|uniref:Uncharacterized protein n=1 Tax=Caenorhabditis briggsae TaxID=6238 RepID=A0AAE9EH74_CAEBR|nr:hypothetical protein L5515_003251 [Caenorhabditis briggsae]
MRPETVKMVRIRGSDGRNDSGSVSPPGLAISGDEKAIFVEKMRKIYGKDGQNTNTEELNLKIEQLWNGLKPSQREKFIGKENSTAKNSSPHKKEPAPMLERRNNCKAIAKVLDLKPATKTGNSYSQAIKGRMKSWRKEGHIINSRICPPSPPRCTAHQQQQQQQQQPSSSSSSSRQIQSEIPFLIVKTDPKQPENGPEFEFRVLEAPKSVETPKIIQKLVEKPTNCPPKRILKTAIRSASRKPQISTKKVLKSRVFPIAQPCYQLSYDDACREYYHTLSHSFLKDSDFPANDSLLPVYADIVQGFQPIREYKFGNLL